MWWLCWELRSLAGGHWWLIQGLAETSPGCAALEQGMLQEVPPHSLFSCRCYFIRVWAVLP